MAFISIDHGLEVCYSACIEGIDNDDFEDFKLSLSYMTTWFAPQIAHWVTIIKTIIVADRGTYLVWFLNYCKDYPWLQNVLSHIDIDDSILKCAVSYGRLDMVQVLLPFTGVQDTLDSFHYVSPLGYTLSCRILSHENLKPISYLLIDNGASLENVNRIFGLDSNRVYAVLKYQRKRQAKHAACAAAVVTLTMVFRKGRAPRDFTQHLVRNFVWPTRNNDAWLTPRKQRKKKQALNSLFT